MLTRQFLSAYVGASIYARAERLYKAGNVQDLDVREDPDTGIVKIEATVKSATRNYYYDTYVTLSKDSNWIMDCECDCPYYSSYQSPCKHVTAVLLEYIDQMECASIGNGMRHHHLHSDNDILSLLRTYSDEYEVDKLPSAPVELEPIIDSVSEGTINAEFRIFCGKHRKYIVSNISDLCYRVDHHDTKKYGKELEFTHNLKAFSPQTRKIISLLLRIINEDDHCSSTDGYYYSYGYNAPTFKRQIQFKGIYADEFINIIQTMPISMSNPRNDYLTPLEIVDGEINLKAELTKTTSGYTFNSHKIKYALGSQYIYFLIRARGKLVRQSKDDKMIPLLQFLSNTYEGNHYISEEDLPAFSKYIYPVIHEHMELAAPEFNPAEYMPEKPDFEIYLDLPQSNEITCDLFSVYGDQKFNVLDPSKRDASRDSYSEQEMDASISPWFNSFDPLKHRLVLINDDDKTYQLLNEGIPSMQMKATVYISDKLKKLQIKSMPKMSAGVSVSHDLLQLDLVTGTMKPSELAEILSRYDRKKKYYRLKSGEFFNIDDSLDDLYNLQQALSLTSSQITSGEIKLPRYRAAYLDELSEENHSLDFDTDESFRNMIRHMKNTDGKQYAVPSDLKATMRNYQLEGFHWLCAQRDNGFGGLLADEMGLGKTLQVIAFLGSWKDRGRSLVVCPASLVYNWSSEIQRFLPSLPSRMINGTAEMRKELIATSGENEVLITSYDLLKRDIEDYKDMHFSCEVIDEAQYIKNAGTQASHAVKIIDAQFKIALTGTPIENRLSELWSIFDYLLPGFFYGYKKFRDLYENPIVKDQDEETEKRLTKMITPFVLRRLKKDVLKDLPDKLEDVYYAPLEAEQKELYDAHVQRLKLILEKQTDEEFKENKLIVLAELTRLRQICCDPGLVYDHYNGASAKADMCIDMIHNAVEEGHKVLLFSQFTSMLAILTERLQKAGLKYHLLEGSTPKKQRADMVESFQTDDVPVFAISLKAGGTGLNLTAADVVIHYDPWWNTAVENQASDRAHRIGQKNVVNVCRLIIKDTIEETILNLQQAKSDLADRILSGEGMSSAKLSRKDLLSLL